MLQNATLIGFLLGASLFFTAQPAQSDTLSVMPTRIEIPGNAPQATMTIKAGGAARSVVQLRIFSWREGQDPSRLRPTRDVAISPPMARLSSRQELTARIVRTKKSRLRQRECYRVLVDRLPDQQGARGQISMRLRHSVPVCFNAG